jgi:hypothetical protein
VQTLGDPLAADSVDQFMDLAWQGQIQPVLLARFLATTPTDCGTTMPLLAVEACSRTWLTFRSKFFIGLFAAATFSPIFSATPAA